MVEAHGNGLGIGKRKLQLAGQTVDSHEMCPSSVSGPER
jgi:hypothetical protein